MLTQLANACRRIAQAIFVPSYVKRVAKTMAEYHAMEAQEAFRREKLESIGDGMNSQLCKEAISYPFGSCNFEAASLSGEIHLTIGFSKDTNNYRRMHGIPMKRYIQIRKAAMREERHDGRR